MQRQTIMVLEACSRCGQAIPPGEPAMQTASVNISYDGRILSSPVKTYHLSGPCHEEHKRRERAEIDALMASLEAA